MEEWTSEDERGRERVTQREIAYQDINPATGELEGVGSEDFSPAREGRDIEYKWIYTWDGQKRNKGGHRWFTCHGTIKYRKSGRKAVQEYLKNKYHAEVVQLRY